MKTTPAETKHPTTVLRRARSAPISARVFVSAWLLSFTPLLQWPSPAAEYYWNAASGTWDLSTAAWKESGGAAVVWPRTGSDNDARIQVSSTITLGTPVLINDLRLAPGVTSTIRGMNTLSLVGAVQSEIAVGTAQLTLATGISGSSGFLKTGSGKLVITSSSSGLSGAIAVNAGILQIGDTDTVASISPLRSNPIYVASGASLTSAGSTGVSTSRDLSLGSLSGQGTVNVGNAAIYQLLLSDASFDGTVTAGTLNLRGPGAQGFTKTIASTLTISSGAGIVLSGASAGSGVYSANEVFVRGGSFVMDNSQGNVATTFPSRTDANFTLHGGRVSLIGSLNGTSETVGSLILSGGDTKILSSHPSAVGTTTLTFGSLSRTDTSTATVNFASSSGMLGSTGSRVSVTTAPSVLNNILGTAASVGYAIVNGADFAAYNSAREIIPATLEPFSGSASTKNALLSSSGATTSNATVFELNSLTLAPSALGQSLDIAGSGRLETSAFLLRGSNVEFTITSSGGGGIGGKATRIFHVPSGTALLSVSASLSGSPTQGVIKSGEGTLSLTENNSAVSGAMTINGGALRATASSLPSGVLQFRGGVLEITAGHDALGAAADFTRPLGALGGAVNWAVSNSGVVAPGSGGFAAVGGNATVSIGGAASPTLTWGATNFVQDGHVLVLGSKNADSRITILNNLALDSGSAMNYSAREFRVLENSASSSDVSRISGSITGSSNTDLLKTGDGTLQVTGTSTYTGHTLIYQGALQVGGTGGAGAGNGALTGTGKVIVHNGGTLILGGTSSTIDRINNSAEVVLDGGTIKTASLSEYTLASGRIAPGVGALTLSADSIIDFAGGGSFAFADSSLQAWSGTLHVYNWSNSGETHLFFGTSSASLTETQLMQIHFYSGLGGTPLGTAEISGSGEVSIPAVPEPSTAVSGLAICGLVWWRERRRFARSRR